MDNVTRMWRIRRTCMEMLKDRNYTIDKVGGRDRQKMGAGIVQGSSGPSWPAAPGPGSLACVTLALHAAQPARRGLGSSPCRPPPRPAAAAALQEELEQTKESFREKFGEEPRREDLTVLATHRVRARGEAAPGDGGRMFRGAGGGGCFSSSRWHAHPPLPASLPLPCRTTPRTTSSSSSRRRSRWG